MINKELIDRVKLIYKHNNYTKQADFANDIEISRTLINRMFTYKIDASKELISKIINKLNVNPTWLMLGKGAMFLDTEEDEKMIKKIKMLEKQVTDLKKENQNLDAELEKAKNIALELVHSKLVKA